MGKTLVGKILFLALVFLLALNFLFDAIHLYQTVFWLDKPMHFLGGALVAAFLFWFFVPSRIQINNFFWLAVILVSLVSLVGVLWEFAEVTFLNRLVIYLFKAPLLPTTLEDTLGDLAFDLLGALSFSAVYYFLKRK